jgi:hypothetical protein
MKFCSTRIFPLLPRSCSAHPARMSFTRARLDSRLQLMLTFWSGVASRAADLIRRVIEMTEGDLTTGSAVTVNARSIRVHRLPLGLK